MGIDRSLKHHLLDIRIRALYGRLKTRCGLLPEGDHPHMVVSDWDNRVHTEPKEGVKYCKRCWWDFKENGL